MQKILFVKIKFYHPILKNSTIYLILFLEKIFHNQNQLLI
jgi:hypothetical protein